MWSTSRLPPGSLRRSSSESVCIMSSDEWRWKCDAVRREGASVRLERPASAAAPARNTATAWPRRVRRVLLAAGRRGHGGSYLGQNG